MRPTLPQTNITGPGICPLVKSPVNYPGGKFRLLPQILPHLPETIGTFVDLFSGATDAPYNTRRSPSREALITNYPTAKVG